MRHQLPALLIAILLLSACTTAAAPEPSTPALPPPTATASEPTPAPTAEPTPAPVPTAMPEPTAIAAPTAAPTDTPADPEEPAEPLPTLTPAPLGRTLALESPPIEGDDVRALQNRLLALGYVELGSADGIYGAQSAEAVRMFQAQNRLDADGVVGPQTWERLFGPSPRRAAGAGPLTPIVEGRFGYLLGAARDGRWVSQYDAAALLPGGETYILHRVDGSIADANGTQPGSIGEPCTDVHQVVLAPDPGAGIAVGTGINARPRPTAAGDADDPELLAGIQGFLISEGITEPVTQIAQVLLADIDGDGRQEAIVAASRLALSEAGIPSPDAAAGDYSLIAVMYPGEEPSILISQVHPQAAEFSAPEVFQLLDLLDLNGDGRLEIVITRNYYEGGGFSVFDYVDGAATEALYSGCGV
jgi:Putative peptidoglycan binding domain